MSSRSLGIICLVVGQMRANCYLLVNKNSKEALIVDAGDDAEYISEYIQKLEILPTKIIATHGHFDHIMASFALQMIYRIPFLIHTKDDFLVKNMGKSAHQFLDIPYIDPPPTISGHIEDNDVIKIGDCEIKIIGTPGHTPGSISLYDKKGGAIFVGDVLFKGGDIGRFDFSYSNKRYLNSSIEKILSLPGETIIYAGHGEETRVALERQYYPHI